MLREKENLLRCYRHEVPDHLPDYSAGCRMQLPFGYHEIPPHQSTGQDWFGVWWRGEKPAAIPDPNKPRVLEDVCDWREKVVFPNLDAIDWEEAVRYDKLSELDRENKLYEVVMKEGPFERIQALMGMQEAMTAMLVDPEEFQALAEAICDFRIRLLDYVAKYYKPDVVNYHDDYGTQRSLMLSPDSWREIFKPLIAKTVEAAHSHGIIFDLHCCGMIEDILPEFPEIGVDCVQCMPINDIARMKRETDGKMVFFTGFDVQKYDIATRCGALTEDGLRKEIRELVLSWAEGGNYIPSAPPPVSEDDWVSRVIREEVIELRKTIYQ